MPNFIPHLKSTAAPATPDNPGATSMTVNIPTAFRPSLTPRRHLRVASAVAAIPLITMLAACGSSSAPAAQATSQATSPATNPAPGAGGQGGTRTFPGAAGLIAAVSPGTLQVQSTTAQNTVVYTASTKFTQDTTGHVAVGDCVTVTGAPVTGSTSGLTATSVRIVAKVNGACSASGAFGGGGAGSFPRRTGGAPSGAPSRARRAFDSATGLVSSTAGSTILVKGVLRSGQNAAGSATPPAPTTISITLPASATVTQTVAATSAAAVVGKCAIAIGTANSAGAINAKSIPISTPGPNGCNAGGFGGRSGGSGGIGSGTGSASGSNA
jgi:hypothetical protein